MNRRSLLIAAGTLTLAQTLGLTGCSRSSQADVQIRLLEQSMPVQLLNEFQRRTTSAATLDFLLSEQLTDLYNLLQSWQADATAASNRTSRATLITLGDYWLTAAIQQGLIQPLDLAAVPGWSTLADQAIWTTLVQRDRQGQPSPTGETWAAPYRWGTLMMAYQTELFADNNWTAPRDWSDLWRPELAGRVSLPDSPRSVIGLTLKQLGQSVNTADLTTVATLETELKALHQQVKLYSSDAYLQPLVLQDTAIAVGWSMEILPLIKRDRRIAAVVPASGTILTADLWVQPADTAVDAAASTLLQQWLAFCWDPPIATQLSLLSSAASPVFFARDRRQFPASLQQNPALLPPVEVLQASEFLLPLADTTIDQYRRLWATVRQADQSR